ncbi:MAG TPA: M3 family oligoendopeptidase [Chitinophagaceae bacterium]|nr:M3 family oligoendopeptidase [Chitinophagaceae bacterium]
MKNHSADISKIKRHFLPADFIISDWKSLEPWFQDLIDREIHSLDAFEKWLADLNELEAVISEDACWRQIRMTCDTTDKALEESFNYFYLEIQPKIQPLSDQLNKKLISSPFTSQLDHDKYFTYIRNVKKNIDLFREENIPIQAEINVVQQQYGQVAGAMTVTVDGQEFTLQQAAKFLEDPSREKREEVYRKINERRLQDKETLDNLFTKLVSLRDRIAVNAGFENYRDYKFMEMGRFDYKPEQCFQFHEAVRLHVMPLVDQIFDAQRNKLGLDVMKPWDTEAEQPGISPLRPFKQGKELLDKTISCLHELDPFFANCLKKMEEMSHLDLDSRKGKAPGGYNMPLAESGAPFIFMNAAGQMSDVTTMVHESGHAVHSFLAHPLSLNAFKEYPTEMAEVASMAMELFTMDHWHVFFNNEDDLRRAKRHQLERVITIFPWIATIDKFQHWIYENPKHTVNERTEAWMNILNEFSSPVIDYSGLMPYRNISWQRQLHLFEVPFYYIEYGIAQLGAIGLWKQYKENNQKAIKNYINGLSLGGTKTLPELYHAAGLSFDFSPETIKELMDMVRLELEKLDKR